VIRILLIVGILATPIAAPAQVRLAADHVFLVASAGAPEAQSLQRAGFSREPEAAKHEGQGTASVFFSFENAYLELIWIDDAEELRAADTDLAARFEGVDRGASPVGIGLHRVHPEDPTVPFPTRSYTADWMKPGAEILLADGQPLNEPALFVVPGYMAWPELSRSYSEFMDHPNGVARITSIRVSGPGLGDPSASLDYVNQNAIVEVFDAPQPLLELEFDDGRGGQQVDLRPDLPLLIRY